MTKRSRAEWERLAQRKQADRFALDCLADAATRIARTDHYTAADTNARIAAALWALAHEQVPRP